MLKEKKGITLIALVITIIVLLILAGVSIAMVAGDNGVATKAANAKDETAKASIVEKIELSALGALAEGEGIITKTILVKELNGYLGNSNYTIEGPEEGGWTVTSGECVVNINSTGKVEEEIDYAKLETNLKNKLANVAGDMGIDENGNLVDLSEWSFYYEEDNTCSIYGYGDHSGYGNFVTAYTGEINADGTLASSIPAFVKKDGTIYKVTSLKMAFSQLSNLTVFPDLPYTINEIGACAFYGTGLTSVNIPDTVTTIGNSAFAWCTKLVDVTIPDSVTTIGDIAFCRCSKLTSIDLPSNLQVIEFATFQDCSSLTTIVIPKTVTKIDATAFLSCDKISTVNYTGTQEEWNQITIDSGNTSLTDATINCNYVGE